MENHENISVWPYEQQLIKAMRLRELEGNPVVIDLVARGLAIVSYGDIHQDDMASIGQALKKVAGVFAIPEREIRRYLQAAIEGDEWNGDKVQILLSQFPDNKAKKPDRGIIGNWRNAV